MQCVILAGGLGTRMRPLTGALPKTLLPVRGRAFAWYQLDWLARHGVTEVVYCIGHQGDKIRRYWEGQPSPAAGLQWPALRFVDEGERLRGTAGALRLAFSMNLSSCSTAIPSCPSISPPSGTLSNPAALLP